MKSRKNMNILMSAVAAALMLTVSLPHSGPASLLSSASAGEGGGDDRMDALANNMSGHKRAARSDRRRTFFKKKRFKTALKRKRGSRSRWIKTAKKSNSRKLSKRKSRSGKASNNKFGWYVLNPGYASGTGKQKRKIAKRKSRVAKAHNSRFGWYTLDPDYASETGKKNRKSAKRKSPSGKAPKNRFGWYTLDPDYVSEETEKNPKSSKGDSGTGKAHSNKFGWYTLDPDYVPETPEQKNQRMIEEKLREELALKNEMKRQFAEFYMREQLKHFGNGIRGGRVTATPPPAAAAPAPQPAAPVLNRNTDWAQSTNTITGITTTSVAMAGGGHQVTLTNTSGAVINQFTVNW